MEFKFTTAKFVTQLRKTFYEIGYSYSSATIYMVSCLLFNSEVLCSNPCVCAHFFPSIPKQKVLTVLGTRETPFFGFVRLFSKKFQCPQSIFPSICLIFCNRTNVKKTQKVPFFKLFGTMKLFLIFLFFQENFLKDSKRSPFSFLKFCNRIDDNKSQRPFLLPFSAL